MFIDFTSRGGLGYTGRVALKLIFHSDCPADSAGATLLLIIEDHD
jgi:hypothetical protein